MRCIQVLKTGVKPRFDDMNEFPKATKTGVRPDAICAILLPYAGVPQHTAVSLRLTGNCFVLNLRLRRRSSRSLESSLNHRPERPSLSAMCGGKAALRDSRQMLLDPMMFSRIPRYRLTTSIARSSCSSRFSLTPLMVRDTGTVG